MTHSRTLIVGGGLAGTALAWRFWQRGAEFVLVDAGLPVTCSKVAAGLVTPITGIRLNTSWRIAELLPEALAFYDEVASHLGVQFYHHVAQVRLFRNERDVQVWRQRQADPAIQRWLEPCPPQPLVDAAAFHEEHGGFQQTGGGWLDTAGYLAASRDFFITKGCWLTDTVADGDIDHCEASVRWRGETYSSAILCRGAEERGSTRFFPWLQWDCARGVIAEIQAELTEHRIVNRNCWLLPRAGGWRAGATYEFDFEASLAESAEALRQKLTSLLRAPFEIVSAQAGIRPILKRRQLVLGRHPAHSRICVFNGLGSKGALRAPFFSRMLVDHLLDGAALEESVDIAANE
ncbi:MAG: NAD(P)/FAD-dependent oxidoreductase [Roseimicrobium sp.]